MAGENGKKSVKPSPQCAKIQGVRGVVFDLDGTLIRGSNALPGAVETVEALRSKGVWFAFCTQDTENDDATNAARLNRMGFGIEQADIVSGGTVTANYLKAHYSDMPIRIIGTQRQIRLFETHGVRQASDGEAPTAVLIGLYPGFSASDLETACRLVWNGADFLAVALDRTLPTANGLVPCTGGLVRAVEYATRRRARIFGKPSIELGKAALQRLGQTADSVLVVGDNLDADIRLGKKVGARTALVLSGSTSLRVVARTRSANRPDMILESVAELVDYF